MSGLKAGVTFEEQVAMEGLDVTGHEVEWDHAKEFETYDPRNDDARLLPYWERVRLTFLELGGEFA